MQAGFFCSVPFVYQCPECQVVSKGEVELPVDKAPHIMLTNLKNSSQTDVQDDQFAIQLSTELYTDKMMKSKGGITHSMEYLSPFMQYISDGKDLETQRIAELTQKIIECINSNSADYSALWNLYNKNSVKYLYKKLKELHLLKSKMKYYNFEKMKDSEKISFMPHLIFEPIMEENFFIEKSQPVKESIIQLRKKNFLKLKEMREFIGTNLLKYLDNLVRINESFITYYNYILPVIVNECVGSYKIQMIKQRWGISQTDFEYLKKYYAENYENLKDMILTIIILQNLKLRGSISAFHPNFYRDFEKPFKGKDYIRDFNQVITKVGNRLKVMFYDTDIIVDKVMLEKVFDNDIRNSINHEDYMYDYNSQKITFMNKGKQKDLFLIEFADILFNGNLLAVIFWELYMTLIEVLDLKRDEMLII